MTKLCQHPRSKGDHLTAAELELLRRSYCEGRRGPDVARELRCSSGAVRTHYRRFKAEGILRGSGPSLKDRLPHLVRITETGCWDWSRYVDSDGYGRVKIRGKSERRAHRAVYEELVGHIPDGMDLDHLCRNRRCVNPEHLEPVTKRENTLRGFAPTAMNARKTHCLNGHSLSGDNIYTQNGRRRQCRTCESARNKVSKAKLRLPHD